jgi:acetyl-CoA acyltransferase
VTIPQRKGDPVVVDRDEHPRATTMEALAKLGTPVPQGGHGHRRQCQRRQ